MSDLVVYDYASPAAPHHHAYLDETVIRLIGTTPTRVFEVGCGNGAFAQKLAALGHQVAGVDPSASGIAMASAHAAGAKLEQGSVYDPLAERFGRFPVVISLAVIPHLLWPRKFAASCRDLVEPGGRLIVSAPLHNYWKTLAIAMLGQGDRHYNPLSELSPIKYWSVRTLRRLLEESGFRDIVFYRAGRVSWLAKEMVAVARG